MLRWQSKMAWEGVKFFFQNQECVNILGCSVTFYEYKNVLLMLVDDVCTIQALFVKSRPNSAVAWLQFVTKALHYYSTL